MNTADKVIDVLTRADLSRMRAPIMAEAVGLKCRRVLEKKLISEGTCYRELLREERMKRCRDMLGRNPRIDGHGLARKCGYTAAAQLYRAFHAWFNVSLHQVKHCGGDIQGIGIYDKTE